MIQHHILDVDYSLEHEAALSLWLEASACSEHRTVGAINTILCSDSYLLDMNKKYLEHDFYTDIITFDTSEGPTISGDLYISIDRVSENAGAFSTSVANELHRVMIHGILHLCGYGDKTETEKTEMRSKEDHYLSLRPFVK